MRKASIDLGTNTALLLIADVEGGVVRSVYHDQSTMVRLGQEVDRTRRLHPDAVGRTMACLRGYAARIAGSGIRPSDAICVATAADPNAAPNAPLTNTERGKLLDMLNRLKDKRQINLTDKLVWLL